MNIHQHQSDNPLGASMESCVYQLFETQVLQSPDSVAVTFRDEHLTYSELDSRANQLAHYLKNLGVGPEVLVGVCADRGIETLIGILGVLKAGGAYLPLDPEYPQQRLSFMLADAEVSVLLTQNKFLERISRLNKGVNISHAICLDTDWPSIAGESSTCPGSSANENNLAYVIYTSGSTGEPKGVLIERRGLCNMADAQLLVFSVQPGDRVLQFSSLSFDASVFEIFMALRAGATLVIVPPESRVPGPILTQLLREQAITIVTLPPSVLAALPQEDLPKLKIVTVAGEACAAELVARWAPGRRFFNLYGPTEATVWATLAECVDGSQKPSIGQAILNTWVYLLDVNLQPVPMGELGELHISGAGLARGYLKRPQLNSEKFIPDPFHGEPNMRLYRTGDICRQLPDGNIEFISRKDDQVKLRGFRIELGEVEATLRSHPGVRDAVVNLIQNTSGGQQLVAHVVPDNAGWQRQAVESQVEQVAQWQKLHDETYSHPLDNDDPAFNITGWLDSYTGRPFDASQMRRWLDHTVARISRLGPRRVYEIGCGSGMLLSRIASGCEQYWACDSSSVALDYVRELLPELGLSANVQLMEKSADDFSGLESGIFDAVIINSVVQYFPNIDYLLKVLEGAVKLTAVGGFVWVGDLRSLPLLETFHTSIQFEQAVDSMSLETLKQRVRQRMAEEQELVIAPAFFNVLRKRLPAISDIRLNLKRGYDDNELTRFRYDVLLRIGELDTTVSETPVVDWSETGLSLNTLSRRLAEESPETLCVTGVPNARVVPDLRVVACLHGNNDLHTVGEIRDLLAHDKDIPAVEAEDIWSFGHELGYETEISWSATGGAGSFDVQMWRAENTMPPLLALPSEDYAKPLSQYANNPVAERLACQQIPALREFLEQNLPHYMVPSAFVLMDALPLTIQGKVDRRALPEPSTDRSHLSTDYAAPRTSFERTLALLWERVLKVDQVGINDNFFELGGDSLLGAVLTNTLQKELGIQLYIVALFDASTVAEQAIYLKKHFPDEVAADSAGSQNLVQRIGSEDIIEFSKLAVAWQKGGHQPVEWKQRRNPRMGFILTTPRSGSSLLRIMLAGNQQLFAPPELELLAFDSLQQRNDCLSGRLAFMREGLVRALMEIKRCDVQAAEDFVARHEARNDSIQVFYRQLQEWIGDRLLVDKSATYSLSSETLAHAEEGFENNIYIHLVRHPYGTIRSFEEARLDRILSFKGERPYSVRQFAELTWIISHQNILNFLSKVPAHRQIRIQFEQLVQNPRPVMENLCDLMNIDFNPLMLEPYQRQEQRMVDGTNAQSTGMSDAKFQLHNRIDDTVADAWKSSLVDDFLCKETWNLASLLGYEPQLDDSNNDTVNNAENIQPQIVNPESIEVNQLSDEEVDRKLQAMLAVRRTRQT